MKEVILEINDLDNPFEREKLESLPKDILVELLIRHLKRNIKAIEYMKNTQWFHLKNSEGLQLYATTENFYNDLSKILKGEDNE